MEASAVNFELLPISRGMSYTQSENIRYRSVAFGYINGPDNKPRAALRENSSSDLIVGLEALKTLRRSGVNVVRHMPLVVEPGIEVLLAEYIDGPTLDEVEAPEDTLLKLARNLASYCVERTVRREPMLTDINDTFQYKLKDGQPILIDIDMHIITPKSIEGSKLLAKDHLLDIGEHYYPKLSEEGQKILSGHLQIMHGDIYRFS